MKKLRWRFISLVLFCFAMTLFMSETFSQQMPPFKMVLSNNKVFSATELPKAKPVVLIYFDPDCDHCQKLITEIFKKINSFKKAEIVMITFKSIAELTAFEKKYYTRKYTNIKTGTEGSFFYLRDYFRLVKMPFTALYDKNQNLIYSYRQETLVDDLISRLKNLK